MFIKKRSAQTILDMANDMIAMASKWEERLRPQNVTEKMTHKFVLHRLPSANPTKE